MCFNIIEYQNMQLKDMLSFYSNGKVFGCYFIVTFILLESNSASCRTWLRGELRESGDIFYSYINGSKYASCLKQGKWESTHVDAIRVWVLVNRHYNFSLIDLTNASSGYKSLIEKVTLDCNGRPECNSSYSGLTIPKPMYRGEPVQYIEIQFSCKPNIDNITVINIGLNLEFKEIKNVPASYLVLRLQNNTNTHRHCKINGGQSAINITVLHVDFGPNSESNKINSDSLHQCHENMTLVSKDGKKCSYTWNSSITFKIIECKAIEVDIDIHMSKGFVWIEIEGGKDFKLNCNESNSNNCVTSNRPSSGMSHSPTTKPTVTTGNGSNTATTKPDSSQSDVVYTTIIPVSVAFLALLIVIVSFVFCVCRRNSRFQVWKRSRGESVHRRDDEYDNVASHEDLDPTYNSVNAPVATDAKKRTRPVNGTPKPRAPAAEHQTPLQPMKTPTASSEPSRKVEQQGEGAPNDAHGDVYATVNKVKTLETATSSGANTHYGNTSRVNMADSDVPTSHQDGVEYSHLADFGKKRNYENIYNG